MNTELAAVASSVGHLGRVQDRLGGNAAAMQAGAAHLVLLHQRHSESELRGAQRAGVAAAPCAKDYES